MIAIVSITMTPNPVECGKTYLISIGVNASEYLLIGDIHNKTTLEIMNQIKMKDFDGRSE